VTVGLPDGGPITDDLCVRCGGCCWSGVVGVSGVGPCHAVAEVAFYPRQRGVAGPVGGDPLAGAPGQLIAEAFPEMVVASVGEWVAVAEPE
jgi:hypothetical protein